MWLSSDSHHVPIINLVFVESDVEVKRQSRTWHLPALRDTVNQLRKRLEMLLKLL